jgi:hypothetical protein
MVIGGMESSNTNVNEFFYLKHKYIAPLIYIHMQVKI